MYLCTNTVLDGSVILPVCLSVILLLSYRNHFPIVQFQNQAHIRNPHKTGQALKTIWGAKGAPIFFFLLPKAAFPPPRVGHTWRPKYGAPGVL